MPRGQVQMSSSTSANTFDTLRSLGTTGYQAHSLAVLSSTYGAFDLARYPYSLRVVLECYLRHLAAGTPGFDVEGLEALILRPAEAVGVRDISFLPVRILGQDYTGVPLVVDLALLRSFAEEHGLDPRLVSPKVRYDLVVDHSVHITVAGQSDAAERNRAEEFRLNGERYQFLRWAAGAFANFTVIPPDTGICHQVNMEYLTRVATTVNGVVVPDSCVGTDSHTVMVNGIATLSWGVGGLEAEGVMLGQPISMVLPEVLGVRLTGRIPAGATATDVVLTITELLRKKGVVGKFVEFCGSGARGLPAEARATIANMAPEYGATVGFFPCDEETLRYLRRTGRDDAHVALVEEHARETGFWAGDGTDEPQFSETIELDLGSIEPCVAGPKRPQDRVALTQVPNNFRGAFPRDEDLYVPVDLGDRGQCEIGDGFLAIAAITSCTNTANPELMIAAGLLAKAAVERGLHTKPWVKTSFAPGSRVVDDYLAEAGLLEHLEALGFHIGGHGCTTCIGNSGPLKPGVEAAVREHDLAVAAVLSGNRNFETRVHQAVKAAYLASPPLVVAYALLGWVTNDISTTPLGYDAAAQPIYLRDIWPTEEEIGRVMVEVMGPEMYRARYANVSDGPAEWQALEVPTGDVYPWPESSYIARPPYLDRFTEAVQPIDPIIRARALGVLGDSITTDHLSPAGNIPVLSAAGQYLTEAGVVAADFNTFGARRGNHHVMARGTLQNKGVKNALVGVPGNVTKYLVAGAEMSFFDAAQKYSADDTPVIIFAGELYGSGSSRDWAAKGPALLGVRAVIARSFERIHRTNLVFMRVLPLEFVSGETLATHGLDGTESFSITVNDDLTPGQFVTIEWWKIDGSNGTFHARCRIDTPLELTYFRHGGILPFVARGLLANAGA